MKEKIREACKAIAEGIRSLFGDIAAGLGCLVWCIAIIGIPVGIITVVIVSVLRGFGVI